ncbi:uncharacterized protein MELLADRAFT_55218 [Melampsora larici-populina 98AG31]|uniref:Uncharacterized protein n=1 Tax=Melampsora larici-populina (strain 98AG31 / pathotype 3-4-7) TaxID=747676 RepID=F4RCE8_MELLP|nr:uncharacterized protein MELLADRAFT_55218 [Melampsora larici-populina 98AG31]EGG09718.1 hypothetical protein MELLADRAFT_55218 [Melampsora larici-populina 98AG31]
MPAQPIMNMTLMRIKKIRSNKVHMGNSGNTVEYAYFDAALKGLRAHSGLLSRVGGRDESNDIC